MNSNELFIISIQRSGSNWLHRCLAEHENIRINGEINASAALVALDLVRAGDLEAQEKLESTGSYKYSAQEYVRYLMRTNAGVQAGDTYDYLADKSAYPCILSVRKKPEQREYAGILNKYFPEAKKILIVRNARDVIVSFSEWKKQSLGSLLKPTPRSIRYFVRHLNNWCLLHEGWISDIENNPTWLVITYERMKDEFPGALASVYKFLGINVGEGFIEHLTGKLYEIDSPVYLEENKDRGYGFFRKGVVGEWEDKFSWWHKLIYNIFFKSRVKLIYERITDLNSSTPRVPL